MKPIHPITLGLLLFCHGQRICNSFAPSSTTLLHPTNTRHGPSFDIGSRSSSSSSLALSSSPVVEFIDPETQARVSLLGVFHGTVSSAQDVETVMSTTSDSGDSKSTNVDVVVLELCASRFADLKKEQESRRLEAAAEDGDNNSPLQQQRRMRRSWPIRYTEMIVQTVQTKGLPTGMAAALLGGFSGLQSAMSGFVPGLEFTTALELCMRNDESPDKSSSGIDIVLADQAVDETLRKLGNLAGTSSDIFLWERRSDGQRMRRSFASVLKECHLHLSTLQQAVFGGNDQKLPQVHLPSVLFRNSAAVQDLVRLALPSTLLIAVTSQLFAVILGEPNELGQLFDNSSASLTALSNHEYSTETPIINIDGILAWLGHTVASAMILSSGAFAAIPVVKTILTERDEILTTGIQAACRRAGKDGRVVAVLGLLHVNGVAKRMLDCDDESVFATEEKEQELTRSNAVVEQ